MEQQTPTGATIPVPKRDDVFRDLLKVAKPPKPADESADDGVGGAEGSVCLGA